MDSKSEAYMEAMFAGEIARSKYLLECRKEGLVIPDFDIRGRLYKMALDLAPEARDGDITAMLEWWGDCSKTRFAADVAAGTGFLTFPLAHHLRRFDSGRYEVLAIDWSSEQLNILREQNSGRGALMINTVHGSLAQETKDGRIGILDQITRPLDLITSFGGLHHVYYQESMVANAEKLMKSGGRFAAADVGAGTALARHFDEVVAKKCLTGHTGYWLSQERLEQLIKPHLSLRLDACEMKELTWVFDSVWQMTMFFKGLHAYDCSAREIYDDLREALGCEWRKDRKFHLNWPMLFFRIVKA